MFSISTYISHLLSSAHFHYFCEVELFMKNYTHIIFDLDRTLWDFDKAAHETLHDLFALYVKPHTTFGFDYFYTRYREVNSGLWDLYRNKEISKEVLRVKRFTLTLEELGLDRPWIANHLADMYVQVVAQKAYLFPWALESLEYLLEKGYLMSVITNGFKEAQYPKVERCGLGKYFTHLFISEEIGYNKPDRRIFDYATNTMNVNAESCIMIGDDYDVDIAGAAAAGIDQVYFNPHTVDGAENKPATFRIKSLKELMNIF